MMKIAFRFFKNQNIYGKMYYRLLRKTGEEEEWNKMYF